MASRIRFCPPRKLNLRFEKKQKNIVLDVLQHFAHIFENSNGKEREDENASKLSNAGCEMPPNR